MVPYVRLINGSMPSEIGRTRQLVISKANLGIIVTRLQSSTGPSNYHQIERYRVYSILSRVQKKKARDEHYNGKELSKGRRI